MFPSKLPLSAAASVLALIAGGSAHAQSSISNGQMDKLQAQITALQQELQAMKKKQNQVEKKQNDVEKSFAAVPTKAAALPPSATVKMSPNNRPSICSADGQNCIALTGRLHFDMGGYSYSPNSAGTSPQHLDDGVNARRARIGVLGTFMGDWNYGLIYDFGGTADGFGDTVSSSGGIATGLLPGGATSGIENAYLSYTGFKPFGVNVALEGGYMDVPYTLDEATSSNDIMFMERASSQVVAANIAAGDFRSAGGIRAYNDWLWGGVYMTGPTSGTQHSGSSTTPPGATEQYGGVARLAWQVVNTKEYSFHVGADVETLFKAPLNRVTGTRTLTLSDRPELRIDPTVIMTTGAIASVDSAQVYSAEAAGNWGPLYVQGEYFWDNIDRTGLSSLKFNGGYVEAGWTLTGESRAYNAGSAAYNAIVPNNPVSLTNYGGWGAWEIAGRYSVTDLNDQLGLASGIAGGKQTVYTAGLNWYVNRNVRFMFDYLHGTIDKQASAVVTTDVGAKFDAGAMRMQVAF